VTRAEGEGIRMLARAQGEVARWKAQVEGNKVDAVTTRTRLSMEAMEAAWAKTPLVLVPRGRRVWFGADQIVYPGAALPVGAQLPQNGGSK